MERIPILDWATYSAKHAGLDSRYEGRSVSPVDRRIAASPTSPELTTNHLMEMLTIEPEDHPPAHPASSGVGLVNVIGGSLGPVPPSPSTSGKLTWQAVSYSRAYLRNFNA